MTQGSRFWIALGFLLSLSFGLALINLNEDLRGRLRDRFLPDNREILAKVVGDLTGGGRSFTVLKIKNRDSLAVEVFENNPATQQSLFRARAILPEHRDASFKYQDAPVNLLLLDGDSDGAMEIVTAAFDENLVPRVHVYKFNDVTSQLETLSPNSIRL